VLQGSNVVYNLASLGGLRGRTAPGDTIKGRDTQINNLIFLWMNFETRLDK